MKLNRWGYFGTQHFRNLHFSFILSNEPAGVSRSRKLREEFQKLELEYEAKFQGTTLSKEDYLIYTKHKTAIEKGHFTYDDPISGYRVMTRLRHFLRGSCCGNACRHCIYDHENVALDIKKQRIFNGAFWVDKPQDVNKFEHGQLSPPLLEKTDEDIYIEHNDPALFMH